MKKVVLTVLILLGLGGFYLYAQFSHTEDTHDLGT